MILVHFGVMANISLAEKRTERMGKNMPSSVQKYKTRLEAIKFELAIQLFFVSLIYCRKHPKKIEAKFPVNDTHKWKCIVCQTFTWSFLVKQ